MSETSRRGRPKGSGIDDRIWLRELGHLIRIDPKLSPTTAIKALGVTDASTIRRLRDKYLQSAQAAAGAGVADESRTGVSSSDLAR